MIIPAKDHAKAITEALHKSHPLHGIIAKANRDGSVTYRKGSLRLSLHPTRYGVYLAGEPGRHYNHYPTRKDALERIEYLLTHSEARTA